MSLDISQGFEINPTVFERVTKAPAPAADLMALIDEYAEKVALRDDLEHNGAGWAYDEVKLEAEDARNRIIAELAVRS